MNLFPPKFSMVSILRTQSSTCPPFLLMHSCARRSIPWQARRIRFPSWRTTSVSSTILLRSSSMFAGGLLKILDFKCPHKKKSRGVRSGDLGGHSTSSFSEITLLPKSWCRRSVTILRLCAGAPSCAHHRRLNWPFRRRANRGIWSRVGTTWSLIMLS